MPGPPPMRAVEHREPSSLLTNLYHDFVHGALIAAITKLAESVASLIIRAAAPDLTPTNMRTVVPTRIASVLMAVFVWLVWCRQWRAMLRARLRLVAAGSLVCALPTILALVTFALLRALPETPASAIVPHLVALGLLCLPLAVAFGRPMFRRVLPVLAIYACASTAGTAIIDGYLNPLASKGLDPIWAAAVVHALNSTIMLSYGMVLVAWSRTGRGFKWDKEHCGNPCTPSLLWTALAIAWLYC